MLASSRIPLGVIMRRNAGCPPGRDAGYAIVLAHALRDFRLNYAHRYRILSTNRRYTLSTVIQNKYR